MSLNTKTWLQGYFLRAWYDTNWLTWILWPFSQLFKILIVARKYVYQRQTTTTPCTVPVIVVGNITVGGTGKTPMVIALAKAMRAQGFCPAIITRGYGAKKTISKPMLLTDSESPEQVSDEALLLKSKTNCPVVVGKDRLTAISVLLSHHPEVDLILSDDGLQHYKMPRAIEIVMVGERKWGNGFCLPAGPLREPVTRLSKVDYVVYKSACHGKPWFVENHLSSVLYHLHTMEPLPMDTFRHQTVHAVAAIGDPQQFFSMLKEKQLEIIEHVFSDHYLYQKEDFHFNDNLPILITEKDAVKCQSLALKNVWVVPLETTVQNKMIESLVRKLRDGQKTARYSCLPSLQATGDLQKGTTRTDL